MIDNNLSKGTQNYFNTNYSAKNFLNQGVNSENNGDPNSCCNKYFFWLTLQYWRKYFDFDEDVIWGRLKSA